MKRLIVWLMIFLCCGVAWAATTTTNYGLYKPAVGDTNWGALINGNFDTIDTQMKTTADAEALNTSHRMDNTQAHSDYLLNNQSDSTTGTITAGGFIGDLTGNADTSTLSQTVNWTAVEALSPINSAAVNWDDIEVSSPMTTSPASSNCLVGVDGDSTLGCYTSFDLSDQTVFYYYDGVTATFKFDASQITPGNERTIYLPDRNATIDRITGSTSTDQDGLLLAASGVIVSNDNFTTTGDTLEMGLSGTFSVLGEIDASSGSVILPSNTVQSAGVNWADLEVLGPINGASVNWVDLETLSRINGAAINWLDMTDLASGGAVSWGNLAEGELANSTVISDDIKDGVIMSADVNWTNIEVLAPINSAAVNWTDMIDLTTGGAVVWGNIAEGELADSTVVSADIKDGTIAGGDLASNIAITSTGVQNYGGATSFEIPNGTGPTVDTAGQVAVDTTDDQLVYYGGAKRVIPYERTACAVIENLAATDDNYAIWMANDAVTITGVGCNCRGTCSTTATFTLEDRGGNAMTITDTNPTCATTGAATFKAVTAGNQLTAGEMLAFDVTNTPTANDEYALCFTYTVDAQ